MHPLKSPRCRSQAVTQPARHTPPTTSANAGECSITLRGRAERCVGGQRYSLRMREVGHAACRARRRSAGRVAKAERSDQPRAHLYESNARSCAKAEGCQAHNADRIIAHHKNALTDPEHWALLRADPVGRAPEQEVVGYVGLIGVVNCRQIYVAVRPPGYRDTGATPGEIASATRRIELDGGYPFGRDPKIFARRS